MIDIFEFEAASLALSAASFPLSFAARFVRVDRRLKTGSSVEAGGPCMLLDSSADDSQKRDCSVRHCDECSQLDHGGAYLGEFARTVVSGFSLEEDVNHIQG